MIYYDILIYNYMIIYNDIICSIIIIIVALVIELTNQPVYRHFFHLNAGL